MKQIMNKFSILTIALICGLSMTSCTASERSANDKASSGTEQTKSTAENKQKDNKAVENNSANETAGKNKTDEKVSGQCTLTKAPVIKGFALGQTVEEIDRRIPGFKEAYDKEKEISREDEKKAGFVLITSGSSGLENSKLDSAEFQDFSFIWQFLDGKLIAYVVNDLRDDPVLANQVSKENNLPKKGWKTIDANAETLTCQGFEVMITNRGQAGAEPGVTISDTQAEKEKKKRGL